MDGQESLLNNLSSKQSFTAGLVGGVLSLCTIGFFILLWVVLGGGVSLGGSANAGQGAQIGPAPTPSAAPLPSEPTVVKVRDIDIKTDHIRGNAKSKISIVEYSDLECPFCKRFHETMKQVVDKYGKDVRWVYRHFPLDQLHSKARTEALATECASEQGKFWEYTDLIYQETGSNDSLDLAKLPEYAQRVGLNVGKFQKCFDDKKYADRVQADADDAVAAGARGTPYSVLVGPKGETIPISGAQPFEAVEQTLKQFVN